MTKETTSENIIRSLVKCCLSISCWDGKVDSPELSHELEVAKKAEKGAFDTKVCYLPPHYAKPITVAASQLRTYWDMHTLPWEHFGWKICTAKKYQSLMDGVVQRKRTFDTAVEELINNYEDVYNASKIKVKEAFRADKFPSKNDLALKYDVHIYRNSVNAANDVRIEGLSDAVVADIRMDVSKQYEDQIQMAVANIASRLRDVATDIIERTSKGAEGLKFATLVTKINKTCDSLNGLNITDDPRIDELIAKFKNMGKVDSDMLHESENSRTDLKSQAKDILTALDNFKD